MTSQRVTIELLNYLNRNKKILIKKKILDTISSFEPINTFMYLCHALLAESIDGEKEIDDR